MKPVKVVGIGLGLLFAAALVWSYVAEQRKRMDAIEAGQKAILAQVQKLNGGGQRGGAPPVQGQANSNIPPQPQVSSISIAGAPIRGQKSAKITLVEFSDFQCPFCGRYTRDTFEQIQKEYVDTGKVRYAFRNYPLEKIHPNAFKAAEAGECASQQNKFWELHGKLFANQQALADADLLNQARSVGIDAGVFKNCVTAPAIADKIRQDLDDGARAGVSGTPFFFLGTTEADGRIKIVKKISGAVPFANFKSALDSALSAQ